MTVIAQVSIYPLGQEQFVQAIDDAVAALAGPGLEVQSGPLSTLVSGDEGAICEALLRAFAAASAHGATAMAATITNVSGLPRRHVE